MTNGNLDVSLKTACLRELESLAEMLGEDDLAREWSEKRIFYERQVAEEQQIVNRKEETEEYP